MRVFILTVVLFVVLVLSISMATASETDSKQALIDELSRNVEITYDDFGEFYWYEHSNFPAYINSKSYVYVYFSVKDGVAYNLRIKNVYTADDWLFIQAYTVKTDNEVYTIYKDYFDVKRDYASDGIWEWYDEPVEGKTKKMLLDMATSDVTMIRYGGENYHRDRTLNQEEKDSILEMIELYTLMSNEGV